MNKYFEKELLNTSMGSLVSIENKGTTISQDITVNDAQGNETNILNLYATVQKGKNINFNLSILDANLVAAHIELIQPEVDLFMQKINELNQQDSMPVI